MWIKKVTLLMSALSLSFAGQSRADCAGQDMLAGANTALLERLDAEAAAQPYAQGRFWEVTKHGRSSVLFGTFHAPDSEIGQVPDILTERLNSARTVYIEMTLGDQERMQHALLMNPGLIYNQDRPALPEFFSKEDWHFMADRVSDAGIDSEIAKTFQPWFLSSVLAMPACVEEARQNGAIVLDREIERMAIEQGHTPRGLDGIDQLMRAFPRGSFEDQLASLKLSLPMIRDGEDAITTAKMLYQQGEIWKIWALGGIVAEKYFDKNTVQNMMSSMHSRMIAGRNRTWLGKLLPDMRRGNAVVAVGAMHLPGEDGLLRMLERDGFTVRRLDG